MIKVIYITFTILIKKVKVWWNNLNLFLKKKAILFKSLALKNKINKQIASTLYYKYKAIVL